MCEWNAQLYHRVLAGRRRGRGVGIREGAELRYTRGVSERRACTVITVLSRKHSQIPRLGHIVTCRRRPNDTKQTSPQCDFGICHVGRTYITLGLCA